MLWCHDQVGDTLELTDNYQNIPSLWNKISKRQYSHIFLEFLPQLIFLLFLFGYLISMIFMKWIMYGADYDAPWSEQCAPNLLIIFIG